MSKWSEHYAGRVGESYASYCETKYAQFLSELLCMPKGTSFREEGCGIGTISRILSGNNYRNLVGFDLCPEQAKLAFENTQGVVPIYIGDILGWHSPVDVIHSHGVIEHFTDEQIENILQRQCASARKVVHYVPTNGYDTPSFGDERLMSEGWWRNKFKPTRTILSDDGCDLVLIWEQ